MARWILALVLALALAPAARAQSEPDAANDRARESLGRFLTEGALAPFARERADQVLARVTPRPALTPGERAFSQPGDFVAAIGSSGEVTLFARSRPLLFVEGKGPERAAEVARRTRFSLEEDVHRGRCFLEGHYPDFRSRVFDLASKERRDHDSLVEDELVFVERPGPGVVACWPNRIDLSVNPEDGSVSTYVATHDRIESTEAVVLDAATARRSLSRELGDRIRPDNREFLAEHARTELIAARDAEGKPRTAWLVAGTFIVSASNGKLLARKGT